MSWSKMVSLELSDEDKIDTAYPCGPDLKPTQPDYPWGLRISLTEKELEKLGLDAKDAECGDEIDLRAFGVVTSISHDERDGKTTSRVEIQIQRMAVEAETAEDD